MPTVVNGVIQQLSVSQVESFDPAQRGGCPRRWWFERVQGERPESTEAKRSGDAGHELLATYLRGESLPTRAKMLKAVQGVIAKGQLPKPGPDLCVEWRGDGQAKFHPTETWPDGSPKWLPLDKTKTLWLGGVPWELFIDLTYRRGDVPHVLDHKFSSDIETYAKQPDELIKTVQMPVYVLARQPFWPDAKRWRITHHYVSRSGVESFMRTTVVHLDAVLQRKVAVERLVGEMATVAKTPDQDDVPFNLKACDTWMGCPHQSICSAFKRRNQVDMTDEEKALFEDFGEAKPAAPAEDLFGEEPAPAAPAAPVDDEIAKLEAQLAAKKAAAAKPTPAPAAPVKERKLVVTAANTREAPVDDPGLPTPAPAQASAAPPAPCACGAKLTVENASKLQNGSWKHIGCPKDAPPPATSATKPGRKAASTPTPAPAPAAAPQSTSAPAAPASAPTLTINVTLDANTLAAIRTLIGQ